MRSLAVKLTLAFLLVGLTGAILVAVLVQYRTRQEFDRLVLNQNQEELVVRLMQYYQANGSWAGVESAFRAGQEITPFVHGPVMRWESRQALFVITDQDGTIVFGGGPGFIGRKLGHRVLNQVISLEVEEETVGWLLFIPTIDRWSAGTPEGNFLLQVNRVIYLSAIVAAGFALILGGILAYTLTRSLRELTAATQELAKGKLGRQVKVRSQDELGDLAIAFNQMSAELARSNELRRKMTADIAHDIRTPLSILMGYTEALNDEKLQPTPEMFEIMHTETRHLSRLVDDLKTLSLADAGELPLVFQLVDPGVLIQRAASVYRVQAEKADVAIQTEIAPDLPEVEVDVERMAQVLGNVIGNALRYTPAGGRVTLSAVVLEGEVQLRVADTGPGIAAEDLPYVFERSFRGDKARQQGDGATGLGLAIARSLVEAQGGKISVESVLGEGTTFTIRLTPQDKSE